MSFNLSVLMSVYYKENPVFFEYSLKSIWDEQILKPSQIVLVKDGPLNESLEVIICSWKIKLGDILTIVPISENMGLGFALNYGLKFCKSEIIARMDTDDISAVNRFSVQYNFLKNNPLVDVVGANVEEFKENPGDLKQFRLLPEKGNALIRYAKFRSPVNHPSIMFRKSIVIGVGGYDGSIILFEDYVLFLKLLKKGAVFYNIQDVLLHFRIGDGMESIKRRSGMTYLKSEISFIKFAYKIGHLSFVNLITYCILKLPLRLLPARILYYIYKFFLRKRK